MKYFLILVLLLVMLSCEEQRTLNGGEVTGAAEPTAEAADMVSFPSFELIGEIDDIFQHPESVIYDSATRWLFVSNVGKNADNAVDGDGYISKLNIHGEIIDPRWLTGLSAPRGMCIVDRILYITDVDRVVKVALASGQVLSTIGVPGAAQLSDLEMGPDNAIYVTDTRSDKIYRVENDDLVLWAENHDWEGPSGLCRHGNQLLVTSAGGHKLLAVDLASKTTYQVADSLHQARGITLMGEDLIVGGLGGQLYGVKAGIDFRWPLIDLEMQRDNIADILYVPEFEVLFVPTYGGHSVLAVSVMR